jgi:flavin-dependent dehydrogenase
MQPFNCIIIGGGLGGLTLSIQLAKQGFSVALFEKETYPFHKVCGEYIAMESWSFLKSCGLNLDELELPKINQLKVSAPNGNFLNHQLSQGGFGISRYKIDFLLLNEAKKCGVHVFENCKVNDVIKQDNLFNVFTNNGNFISNLVIGSYGKRSNLDIKFKRKFIQNKAKGLTNYIGVKYHLKANIPANNIELHNFKDGYCGISKIEDDKYCLCYLTTAQNLKNNNGDVKEMEKNVLQKNPFLNNYLNNFESLYTEPLVISQVNFSNKTQNENEVIMLGDAAGLITPLCGNGMSMAMNAAKILSELIPQFLTNKIPLEKLIYLYTYKWKSTFGTRLWAGRKIQSLFGNEFTTNLLISSLKPFPFITNKLVSLTHGNSF